MHEAEPDRHRFAYRVLAVRTGSGVRHPPAPGSSPVVVGIDGSPESAHAAAWAAQLARGLEAEVVAVHALPFGRQMVRDASPMGFAPWRHELEVTVCGHWCEPIREAEVAYRALLVERPVVAALVGVAGAVGASRIVVGARRAPSGRFHSGLASQLSHQAGCAVVAVPLPAVAAS